MLSSHACLSYCLHLFVFLSAIIYQCVRVLSALPTQYVTELIEQGQQPFRAVKKFVSAQNHILKYLGLRCLTFMNDDFWDESWRDGTIISEAIAVSCGDSTLADEVSHLMVCGSMKQPH